MKRMASRKSHSWWWDSHISPKNSRWLFENLEQMDRLVKEMLKLIEEEGDTFAKKAEMYYQRRPKLLSHVEDFYRMYRALAERYDNVTGELRKNMPSHLQSQSSGNGSDFGTELASPSFSPSPDQTPERKKNHPKPFRRAAGFDVFLGSAASSDFSRKDSDESPSSTSSSESGSDSEDGKVVDAEENTSGLNTRIIQLEEELRAMRQKLMEYENGFSGCDEHQGQVEKMGYESENKTAVLEGEIRHLKEAMEVAIKKLDDEASLKDQIIEEYKTQLDEALKKLVQEKSILEIELTNISDHKLEAKKLAEENSILEIRILEQEQMVRELKASAESSERLIHENSMLESKLCSLMNLEKIQAVKLQALEDRVRELGAEQCEACDESSKLITELNQSLEGYKLKVDMLTSKENKFNARMIKLTDSENIHEANLQVLENRVRDLEAEKTEACDVSANLVAKLNRSLDGYKLKVDMLTSEKVELNARVSQLFDLKNICESMVQAFENRLRDLEGSIVEAHNESVKHIDELNQSFDSYNLNYDVLTSKNDELIARVSKFAELKNLHEAKIQALENRVRELESAKAEACNESMKGIDELNQSLDRYRLKVDMLTSEKAEVDARVSKLIDSKSIHEAEIQALENRLSELEAAKTEGCNESGKQIDELNRSLDRYKLKVDKLTSEKDELNARLSNLMDDAKCQDDNSRNMAEQLHHLHIEHGNLIKEIEEARKVSERLTNRVRELEGEVERQGLLILDGAEGKREAIRQLCFSLEHYRDGYMKLRRMLQGHNRRLAIMAR